MARNLKVVQFKDFTGGLNISSQRQNLSITESPDLADIDFNRRGGITLRRGYNHVATDANMSTTAGYLVGQYSFGTEKLWGVSDVGRLWTWTGAIAAHVVTAITTNVTTEFVRGETWTSKLYFANAYNGGTTLVMRTWNDTAFATLGNTANNNYTAPVGGQAPLARLIASHSGHMFWADTVEGGIRFRSRIRFSHPLQPEDWATADYFDIDMDDQTDQITALIPFRGQLLIFKRRSVYALYGTDRDSFQVERISATAGCWSQESVTASQDACFWWSPDGDVLAYDGRTVSSVGSKINIVADNGTIIPGDDHRVMWAEGRLWVSFKNANGTRTVYVYDPLVGAGAWTRYNVSVSSMFWWRRTSGVNGIMVRVDSKAGVADFNLPAQTQDFDGTTSTSINGYYTTGWFSADDTALLKRWKRMMCTASCGDEALLNVDVFRDFDESTVVKTLTMPITPVVGSELWGAASLWGVGVWGSSAAVYAFDRLQSSGRGHAIRYKFYVTGHVSSWSIDSFALPFLQKAYK